jgi:hypothetical protein
VGNWFYKLVCHLRGKHDYDCDEYYSHAAHMQITLNRLKVVCHYEYDYFESMWTSWDDSEIFDPCVICGEFGYQHKKPSNE